MSERISFSYSADIDKNPHPGLFVVVEGLDGSGNTTQVTWLYNKFFYDRVGLTDKHILKDKEPTYGPFGAPVNYAIRRNLVVDFRTLQLGFTTDRSDHLENGGIIRHLQTSGNVVLLDRFSDSTVAFGYASGLDIDWLIAVQSNFIRPDLVFFLDTPADVCLERIRERNEGKEKFDLFEKKHFLEKAREGYHLIMEKLPGSLIRVDGIQSIGKVFDEITTAIEKHPKW